MDPLVRDLVRLGLALVFVSAASHKVRDLRSFEGTLAAYWILPTRWTAAAARALPFFEALVAVGLALDPSGVAAPAGACVLLVTYSAAIAVNLRRGRRAIDCGCGGGPRPIGSALLVRNGLLLLAAAGLVALPVVSRPYDVHDFAALVAAGVATALLWRAAGELSRAGRHRLTEGSS